MALSLLLAILTTTSGSQEISRWLQVPEHLDSRQHRWVGSPKQAFSEARRRRCHVLVILGDDDSAGVHSAWHALIAKREFLELTREMIVVPAIDTHYEKYSTKRIDGEDVPWCEWFQMPTNARKNAHRFFKDRMVKGVFWQPLYVLLGPDGKEVERMEGHEIELRDLLERIQVHGKELGRSVSFDRYRGLISSIRKRLDSRGNQPYSQILRSVDALAMKAGTDGFADLAAGIRNDIIGLGLSKLDEAKALLAKGQSADAIEVLGEIVSQFRDLPPAESAARKLSELDGR